MTDILHHTPDIAQDSEGEVKKIRFMNVFEDGSRFFSFVFCRTKTADLIIYARINDVTQTTHTNIFEIAVQEYGFNEAYEPKGGGTIDTRTCELSPSLHYGEVDERIKQAAFRKARCD